MRPVPASKLRYVGEHLDDMGAGPCYCCGADGTERVQHNGIHWHVCTECGGKFVRAHGLVVFDCPAHGIQEPVQVLDEDVHWWKRNPAQKNVSKVKTISGKKVSLLTWEEER